MKKISIILFILLFEAISFGQSHLQRLATAKVVSDEYCAEKDFFSHAECKVKLGETIRYTFLNEPPVEKADSLMNRIREAYNIVADAIDRNIEETKQNPHFLIEFKYLDGVKGKLAECEYPNCIPNIPQKMVFDCYDLPLSTSELNQLPDTLKVHYYNPKDIYTIALHELGHGLGERHVPITRSIMEGTYKGPFEMSNYDVISRRIATNTRKDFLYERDSFIYAKNSRNYLTNNFQQKEFATKCDNDKKESYIHSILVDAIDMIRDYYTSLYERPTPIIITSSFRSNSCNMMVGGASQSTHLSAEAIDWTFADKNLNDIFMHEIEDEGEIATLLMSCGVSRLGFYDTHLHMDVKKISANSLMIFDYRNALTETAGCGL